MKLAVPPAFACLFLGVTATVAHAQGVTYPNGTVSPFAPGFFGVGIPPGASATAVSGVAAQNGNYIAAVGRALQENTGNAVPALFLPGGGITILPSGNPQNQHGQVFGISADGKIKVGQGGSVPVYWDMTNQAHPLPLGPGELGGIAQAVSANGARIAGYVERPGSENLHEAVVWQTGGGGATYLGYLPGFQTSAANALTDEGQIVCGISTRRDDSVFPPAYQIRGFKMYMFSGGMESLGTHGGNVDTLAYGISSDGTPVGRSGTTAVLFSSAGVFPLPGGGDASAFAIRYGATALQEGGFPDERIVGARQLFMETQKAVMWNSLTNEVAPIKELLSDRYKRPIGKWQLTAAYALSADAYAVAGEGINPDGKTEGWVAVMPPILRPPRIRNAGPRTAKAGTQFTWTPEIQYDPVDHYSAKGLPPGFQIDSSTGEITGTWDITTATPGVYSVTVKATRNGVGTGSATFRLTLPPPSSLKQLLGGTSFLRNSKPIGTDSVERSFGFGLSENGVVVGQDGSGNDSRAFRFTAQEGISELPLLPGAVRAFGMALASNANGNTIVGQATAPPDEDGVVRNVAVAWQNPIARPTAHSSAPARQDVVSAFTPINLGLLAGGTISTATGVSADGSVVCGNGDAREQGVNYAIWEAFRWTAAGGRQGLGWLPGADKFSRALGISPDGSVIVGIASDTPDPFDGTTVAFRWTQAGGMVNLGRLPGGNTASARAVSADNSTIVGDSFVNASDTHAFRWTAATGMVDLGALPGDNRSTAHAVSADGAIVVGFSRAGFATPRAFIWDAANGMRDLKAVLVAGNPHLAGWSLRVARGISADGKIITGEGVNPNGDAEGFTAHLNSVIAIHSFSPPSGVPGTTVTILGTRFIDAGSVSFNGTQASFVAETDEQITATVPLGATTGPISIMNPSDTAHSSAQFVVLADSDQDGMSDAFEQQYFGSATAGQPNDDSDGDGLTNLQEYKAGTNPTSGTSRLRIQQIRRQGNDIVIVFEGIAQRRYRVEAGSSLHGGYPLEVETLGPSSSDVLHEVIHVGAASEPPQYYRAVLLP